MKRIYIFFVLVILSLNMHGQSLDITIQSQTVAVEDTGSMESDLSASGIKFNDEDFISETYQIPCYGLYDRYWDTKHLASRFLTIPFGGNSLRIILVQSNNNGFFYPCVGNLKTSYGQTKAGFHPGVDLAVAYGSPVKNCFDGVVRMACNYGEYGKVVVVRHYNGLETVYANLSKILVKPGQILQAGVLLGVSGRSLKTGAEILHFETRFMNECFDPALCIDFSMEELKDNTLVLSESNLAIAVRLAEKPVEAQKHTQSVKKENGNRSCHIVKNGDTMYRISLNYNIPLPKLLQLNNMKETDVISIGQKIKLE